MCKKKQPFKRKKYRHIDSERRETVKKDDPVNQ